MASGCFALDHVDGRKSKDAPVAKARPVEQRRQLAEVALAAIVTDHRHVQVGPAGVARALAAFERTMQRAVAALDERYPQEQELDVDGLAAVIDLSAWVHAEWVRMQPFANGNGRTARIWANVILMRYGLPPAVRLRPRPGGGYGLACAAAMDGDWRPTAAVFRTMLEEVLSEHGP